MSESTFPYALSLGIIGVLVLASLAVLRIQADSPSTSLNITNIAPEINTIKLCSGSGDPSGCSHVSSVTLTGGTTTPYSISGTVTDDNGFGDITVFEGRYFRTLLTPSCSADDNNCYIRSLAGATCTLTSTSSTSGTFECPVSVQHYADATDAGSTVGEGAFPGDNWTVWAFAQDQEPTTDTSSVTNEINSLRDIAACASINYGTLSNGAASTTGVTCAVQNDGNVDVDIEISGTAMTCTVGSIAVTNQRVDIVNASYASMGATGTYQDYTGSAITFNDLILNKRTAGIVTDDLYHTISVPFSVSGSCSGTNTISAVAEV